MEQAQKADVKEVQKIDPDEVEKTEKEYKARAFWFTAWKHIDLPTYKPNLVYGCMCDDICPSEESGRFHIHVFLYFKNPISFKTIQGIYGKEIRNFTVYRNSGCINYILDPNHKHGATKSNRIEFGTRPMDNGVNRIKTKEALKMTDEEIMDLAPREAACVMNLKEKFACTDLNVKTTRKNMNVIYICGPSDIGKTRRALDIIEEIEPSGNYASIKFDGHFWHGAKNTKTKTCLYDEWRDYKMEPDEFLNFIDYNKHPINVKNGEKINEFENIIITTTQHPAFIYKHRKEEPKQWFKRFKLLDLYDPNIEKHRELFKENNGIDIEELELITEEKKKYLNWKNF